MQEVDRFFEKNYNSLARYCRAKWDGSGRDVLHSAYILAAERYERINFSLFKTLCTEAAAREVEMYRYGHDENDTIIMPPTQRAAERLDQDVEEDEHVKKLTRIARKMVRDHHTGQMCLFLASKEVR